MRSAGRASSRTTTGRRPSRATPIASPTVRYNLSVRAVRPLINSPFAAFKPSGLRVHTLGPESVGLDAVFVGLTHLYGLPERSTGLNLPTTRYAIAVSTTFWAAVCMLT